MWPTADAQSMVVCGHCKHRQTLASTIVDVLRERARSERFRQLKHEPIA